METFANSMDSTPTNPRATKPSTDAGPGNSPSNRPNQQAPIEERHLRSASIVNQNAINRYAVAVIGVGAIGSHLTEMLAKLGVLSFILIDPDEVDTVNLGVQGFHECEVGLPKVEAVSRRLRSINSAVDILSMPKEYVARQVPGDTCVFCCVDSIRVRRRIFRDFQQKPWPVMFDGRMAAESLRVFCVERDPLSMQAYESSLFQSHEAHRESCTARATIYAASMAAAVLCAQFKRWAMGQGPESHIQFDLLSMDCFR